MAILITGGTGFLGSHLTRLLVIEKHRTDVVLLDNRPATDRIKDVVDDVTIVEGDMLDVHKVMDTMSRYDIDRVVHFAFLSGDNHPDRIVPYVNLTVMGTVNVWEAARLHGVKRIVNPSSMSIWSPPFDRELTEEDAKPQGLYAATKLWTEHLAHVYNVQHGMEILSIRIPATMGRGRLDKGSIATGLMGPQSYQHFMAFPEMAALGHPVTMPPDEQLTEFCYAADTAEAFWRGLTAPKPEHEVFSLTAGRTKVGEITKRMRELLPDAEINVSTGPSFPGPMLSNRRLVEELGFKPRYTVETGVKAYIDDVLSAQNG